MLKVDISRRYEVAVKMKERNKSDHEIKPSFRLNAQGEWFFLPDRAYETDSSFKKKKEKFHSVPSMLLWLNSLYPNLSGIEERRRMRYHPRL